MQVVLGVREALRHHVEANSPQPSASATSLTAIPALEQLQDKFGLFSFESNTIVLCVAAALWSDVDNLCARFHQNPKLAYPTFSLLAVPCSDNFLGSLLVTLSSIQPIADFPLRLRNW